MPLLPIYSCDSAFHKYGLVSFGPTAGTHRSTSSKAESKRYHPTIEEEDDELAEILHCDLEARSPPSKQPLTERHH